MADASTPTIPLTATFSGNIMKDGEGNIKTNNVIVTFNEDIINDLAAKLNSASVDAEVQLPTPSSGGKSRKSRGGKSRKTRGGKMRKTKKHKK